jgi:hypothetical protein
MLKSRKEGLAVARSRHGPRQSSQDWAMMTNCAGLAVALAMGFWQAAPNSSLEPRAASVQMVQ